MVEGTIKSVLPSIMFGTFIINAIDGHHLNSSLHLVSDLRHLKNEDLDQVASSSISISNTAHLRNVNPFTITREPIQSDMETMSKTSLPPTRSIHICQLNKILSIPEVHVTKVVDPGDPELSAAVHCEESSTTPLATEEL